MRMLNEITIHGSVTSRDWMARQSIEEKVAEIRRWHLARGFNDIGYHFVIDRDGKICRGRDVERVGAGVANQNTGKIHICLLGGLDGHDNDWFASHYTLFQDSALRDLIEVLCREYGNLAVRGHNDHAATACPQFQVADWLARVPHVPRVPRIPSEARAAISQEPSIPVWLVRLIGWLKGRMS